MPWIAVQSGDKVWPEEVDDGSDVSCPECGQDMFPRGPTSDGRARHFAHKSYGKDSGGSDCSGGGESDTHKRWKSFAASRLKQILPEEVYTSVELEKSIPIFEAGDVDDGIKNNQSGKSTRDADVYVEFEENHHTLGRGIAVEVQYKNKGKDKENTEADYLSQGVSVLWLESEDFSDDRCTISKEQLFGRVMSVFSNAVPEPSQWEDVEFDIANVHARHNPANSSWGYLLRDMVRSEYDIEINQSKRETSVHMPRSWYEEIAKRYYRDTPWGQIFHVRSHESYLTQFRYAGPSERLLGFHRHFAHYNLDKWLNEDDCLFVQAEESTYRDRPEGWHLVDEDDVRFRIQAGNFVAEAKHKPSEFMSRYRLREIAAPQSFELPDLEKRRQPESPAGSKDSGPHTSATSKANSKTVVGGSAKETRRKRSSKRQKSHHRKRYEGWDEESAPEGYVRRFDKTCYQWVNVKIDQVPSSCRR